MSIYTVTVLLERLYVDRIVDKIYWSLTVKPMCDKALVVIRGAQKKHLIPKKPFNNVCHA